MMFSSRENTLRISRPCRTAACGASFSLTHDLPDSLVLSLQLKTRYPRGFSAYSAASQRAVFALSDLPVYLVASRLTRFSLGLTWNSE